MGILEGHRVLVVEDHLLIGEALCDFLADAGAEVVGPFLSAELALEVLAKVDAMRPTVASLDWHLMGEETSASVAHWLEEQAIPFLFFSGSDHAEIRSRFAKALIVSKPGNLAELPGYLAGLLASVF